jgi:N-acetylmuramoyl-L-alanine amidase
MSSFIRLFASVLLFATFHGTLLGQVNYKYRGTEKPIREIREGDLVYISLTDIARAAGCGVEWNPEYFEATIKSGQGSLVISLFSSYVAVGDQSINITYPALYRRGDLYVPAQTFIPALDRLLPASLLWNQSTGSITADDGAYNVTDIGFQPKLNGFLIEIALREKLPYEAFITERDWINVNIFGGRANERLMRTRPHTDAVYDVKVYQFDESAQISVQFFKPIDRFYHSFVDDPPRIQISIADTSFNSAVLDSLESGQARRLSDAFTTIIIDAGHGGEEDGAIGPQGTKEKDIVLSVALTLRELFESDSGLTVIMTRTTDTTLTLQNRADLANSSGGSLYLSIHANASADSPDASGSQTFFLASALNDAARATAMLENRSLMLDQAEGGQVDDLDFILLDLLQTEYLSESQELATLIQDEMKDRLKIKSRGVDQAGFFVLNKVFMPSVLVELAFISNKREEALLKKESFQQEAAQAIYDGARKFIAKFSNGR